MQRVFAPSAQVPKETSVQISVSLGGPYGDSLFRRLMASRLSGGEISIAGIACVVDELSRNAGDANRFSSSLSAKYILRDLTGTARNALWREPLTDPRFLEREWEEGWCDAPQPETDTTSPGYKGPPQEPYAPPAYSSRRRGRKAGFRRRMKRLLTKNLPPIWEKPTMEPLERAMSFYERIGWQEVYEFAVGLAALDDEDRKLFDALVLGTPDVAVAAEFGLSLAALPTKRDHLLEALKVPNIARAALLAGILDERKP